MSKLFIYENDCPDVEKFIWNNAVAVSWSEFDGIRELSLSELTMLKALCDIQIQRKLREEE